MTLKEIAVLAGVHPSTVSRIINSPNNNFATKELRDRVWAIIKETGYTPLPYARALGQRKAKGQTQETEAIVCLLGRRVRSIEENPFFAQVFRAAAQQALTMRYTLIDHCYHVDKAILDWDPQGKEKRPLGAILLGRFDDTKAFTRLEAKYKNLIFVGRNVINASWDQVLYSGYEAAKLAMEYLISNGHRRIGYIGETGGEARYQAYLDCVAASGLDGNPKLITACGHNSGDEGYKAAGALLQKAEDLPTAIFCGSDVTAAAVIHRLNDAAIKVPAQISVMGMDNLEIAEKTSPMLTTISMPTAEMGRMAAQLLIGRINKLHSLPLKLFLPHSLVVRESVANIN
ncbi:MAG TPA: LacI family DNA-binding transcriptional regulator [Desulfosporosinus sp.]|nr:LacI family DNA-binding transcriptional regulator [Desulfosporosinus sp.]